MGTSSLTSFIAPSCFGPLNMSRFPLLSITIIGRHARARSRRAPLGSGSKYDNIPSLPPLVRQHFMERALHLCLLLLSVPWAACAQSGYTPVLLPVDYHPELVGGIGKWNIHAPTIPGWRYSLEEYNLSDQMWKPLSNGQYYGNGQPLKFLTVSGHRSAMRITERDPRRPKG